MMRPATPLRRCPLVAVVLSAFFAVQMCRTVVRAVDEEQAVREWLENYYSLAERCYFEFINASWNFNVNITRHNNQLLVSFNRVDECLAVHFAP